MILSDLISLIAIILAIFAFINDKERLFIINKFSRNDIVLIVIVFFFINFLLYYKWWSGVINTKNFEIGGFPSPNTWAYITILAFICWIIYKVFFSHFPLVNQMRVLNYYEFLINRKEYDFLFNLLIRYENDILLKIEQNSNYKSKLNDLIFKNKDFLRHTSHYNFQFLNQILIINKSIKEEYFVNFIESQLTNKFSYLYSRKIKDLPTCEYLSIIAKNQKLKSLIANLIKGNEIPPLLFIKFILNYCQTRKEYSLLTLILNSTREILELFEYVIIEYEESIEDDKISLEEFKLITTFLISIENDNLYITNTIISNYTRLVDVLLRKSEKATNEYLLDVFKEGRSEASNMLFKRIYEDSKKQKGFLSNKIEISFNQVLT